MISYGTFAWNYNLEIIKSTKHILKLSFSPIFFGVLFMSFSEEEERKGGDSSLRKRKKRPTGDDNLFFVSFSPILQLLWTRNSFILIDLGLHRLPVLIN